MLEAVVVGRLLGCGVGGTLTEPGISGLMVEVTLNQWSLVDTEVLVRTVPVSVVIVTVELGASVMTPEGSVSGVTEEVSVYVGRNDLWLVELEKVTISVVEGMTENGVVGADVTSVLGLMSTHGVSGEVGTIVMVMVSGQDVVEGREM